MDKINITKQSLLDERTGDRVSGFFKIMGDPTRIKILFALKSETFSVNELAEILEMSHSAISHQLRVLRDGHLVINKKIGKEVYYRLADDHVHTIFDQAIEHVREWGR